MTGLTIIIVLLILGVLLDGLRRVRRARASQLHLSKRVHEVESSDIRVSQSEFPSGGARVVTRRDSDQARDLNDNVRNSYASSRTTLGAPQRLPEQISLNLEETIPMLMDSVETVEAEARHAEVFDSPPQTASANVDIAGGLSEPDLGNMQGLDDIDRAAPEPVDKPSIQASSESENGVAQDRDKRQTKNKNKSKNKKKSQNRHRKKPGDVVEETGKGEVLVINIMASKGQLFAGEDLLKAIVGQKLKFGEMDIFHRHEHENGAGSIIFSLANMVVPGTFNLAQMKNFRTPGVSLFMQLPLSSDSLDAFEIMVACAKAMAEALSAHMKDENRSVMTAQTFEHYRQRVLEFERRRKLEPA